MAALTAAATLSVFPSAAAGTAGARRGIGFSDTSMSTTGSLTVVWKGDAAQGCAAEGLCSLGGAASEDPFAGDVFRQRRSNPVVSVYGLGTARVRRNAGSGAPAECLDSLDTMGTFILKRGPHGLEALVQLFDVSGRCGGPLAADLGHLTLPAVWTGRGHRVLDLKGSVPFTAPPFSGRLISTLVLRPQSSSGSSFSSGSSKSSKPPKRKLYEQLALRYALSDPGSSFRVGFGGDPGPFCEALDDCGARGNLILGLPERQTRLELFAERKVDSRRSARQVLHDFRSRPGSFAIDGFAALPALGVQETFSWPGGPVCRDDLDALSPSAADSLTLFVHRSQRHDGQHPARKGLVMDVTLEQAPTDPLRTHCPGPESTDVFGQSENVAVVSLPMNGLLRRHQVVDVRRGGVYDNAGYVVRPRVALRLHLSLTRVSPARRSEP